MKKLLALAGGVFALDPVFAVVQSPMDCHLFFDGTNTVPVVWNACPGKSCVLNTTTNVLINPFTAAGLNHRPFRTLI